MKLPSGFSGWTWSRALTALNTVVLMVSKLAEKLLIFRHSHQRRAAYL
jgi:hypothetical protein